MKKLALILASVMLLVALTLGGTTVAFAEQPAPMFAQDAMQAGVRNFIAGEDGALRDRTCFSENEVKAAEYIRNRLVEYGYDEQKDTLSWQKFSVNEDAEDGMVYRSQNVIATYNPGKKNTVVIGANYDNIYAGIEDLNVAKTENEGVMSSVTAVVTLLSLAEAFIEQAPKLEYTVTFAFFGASEVGVVGSTRFVEERVKNVNDVLLMINLDSLAGKTITVYSDEVETNESKLFLTNGKAYATDFVKLSRSVPIFPQSYAENLPYSHVGLMDDHVCFYEKYVPVIAFKGGSVDGFNYYTLPSDSIEQFEKDYPDYGKAMADTATLVYGTLTAEDFVSTAATFRDKTSIAFFNGGNWAVFVEVLVVILLAVILILVVKKLEKKYPMQPPKVKKLKIAVFGMDYEDKTDNDIYVDLQPRDNPFPPGKDDIDPFK